ncbi:MAG: SagB/ThcOx family dehydrogenase [Planctomycetota bacterium]|jgi:SagB-type dehydrogenase family enzyme
MKLGIGLIAVGLAGAVAAVVAFAVLDGSEKEPEGKPAVLDGSEKQPEGKPAAPAKQKGEMSLEEALAKRRSVRNYKDEKLTDQQIAQLCWATQGVTEERRGFRTAPSAGALYPLELYVVTADGVRHYLPGEHALADHLSGDVRAKLRDAALGQEWVGKAPATFVITAVYSRTAKKYGRRARRYVHIETGHAAQNLLLQATALELAAVPVGAFIDEEVAKVLSLPEEHAPLYLIPVGVPAK